MLFGSGWVKGQTLLLNENFGYSVGTDLTTNGWNITGTNASPTVAVSASSISYAGYLSSGVGAEVTMAVSGQDVNRTFTAQTSGTVYASILVNVTSATTTGDYFFHLGATTIGSTYHGRVYIKRDASNNLAFGISRAGAVATAIFTTFSYALNTTYLLVLKYTIVAGTTNDISAIYINPALSGDEPATGWTTSTDTPTDLANIGSVALRQGGTSTGAALKIDGIRVGTSWDAVTSNFWSGSSTTDWATAGNWSDGVPQAAHNLVIPSTANQALISSGTSASCVNLKVLSGATLTVNTGGSLTNSGTVTVNSGATIATGAMFANNGTATIEGAFQLNENGWINNAPTYGSGSTLIYNTGGTYGRGSEWSSTNPANITLSNNTTLNYPNGSNPGAKSITGNLAINSGSALYMDYGGPGTAGALTIGGNVTLAGALSLGDANGGDLKVGGNWSNSGTFIPNNRAVFFNGTGDQTIGASTFDWLLIDKASGTASLNGNVIVNNTLTVSNGAFTVPDSYYLTTQTLTNNGTMVVQSGSSNSGSLIISGSYSGSGTFTYQRYMTGSKWHMTGSPLTGQAINSSFLTSNNVLSDGSGGYFMKYFNENFNSWSTNFTDATSDAFELAQAFAVKRNGDGLVNLSGTPNNAEVNATLVQSVNGWNLLANPFTSAIAANTIVGGQNSLLKDVNISNLESSYATLYVWEEGVDYPTSTNYYKVITNEGGTLGQNYVQVGQGFFVKSKSGGGTFNFAPNMQSHQTATAFKSEPIAWTRINLNAEISNAKASTRISYNENMTKGLDISYDAGLLNSYPQFALYSKLIEDNGNKFMVQCLPTDFENLVVPIGLDAQAGEIVKFSAQSENLPDNYKVVLEDRTLGVFTNLSEDNAEYSIQLINESRGTGRFFVRTSIESALGIGDLDNESPYKVFTRPNNNQIVIRGNVNANTSARIYTISGKQIAEIQLKQSNESLVQFNEEAGVYIVKISNEKGTTTQKFVWVK